MESRTLIDRIQQQEKNLRFIGTQGSKIRIIRCK